MTSTDQERTQSLRFNNSEIIVPSAGTDITYNFVSSGIDSATTIYMGMGKRANSIQIRPSSVVKIISINGFTLKDPITVQTTGFVCRVIYMRQIVIRTTEVSTDLKVFAS